MVMGKRNKNPRNWTDEDRRERGYMTIDEFVTKFSFGLKEYLHENWRSADNSEIHHPEDLTSNMLCYAESVYSVVGIFGVGSTNEKD
jgi:hypothetical protein